MIIAENVSKSDPMSVICQIKIPAKIACHNFVNIRGSPDNTDPVRTEPSVTAATDLAFGWISQFPSCVMWTWSEINEGMFCQMQHCKP